GPLGVRQVHPAALPQPPGDAHRRADHFSRRGRHPPRYRRAGPAPAHRLRVPELCPVPAPLGARQRHPRPSQAAGHGHLGGGGAGQARAAPHGHGGTPPQIPRPAFRRPEAAGGHRPGPGHGPGGAVLRRAHLGPRPADVPGDHQRDQPAAPGQRQHAVRHPRPVPGPLRGRPGAVSRPGGDPRRGRRRPAVRQPRRSPHPRLLQPGGGQSVSDWLAFFQAVTEFGPGIVAGLGNTLLLAAIITVTGLAGGILVFYLSLSQNRLCRKLTEGYISFFTGTPLIALLFLMYYGLPQWGLRLSPLAVAVIGFTFNVAAYNARYLSTAYRGLDQDELEAARAQGFSSLQVFRLVTLP